MIPLLRIGSGMTKQISAVMPIPGICEMNYDNYKRADPARFFVSCDAKVDPVDVMERKFPLEIWQEIASYCDYKTLETFEQTMYRAPGQPLLWYHLERPFSKVISSMNPVRPMPAFSRLCRRGLPQETIEKMSLSDAALVATSLSSSCRKSFLYLQVQSEKYRRPLMRFLTATNVFLENAHPFHSKENAAVVPRRAGNIYRTEIEGFLKLVQEHRKDKVSCEGMLNTELLNVQMLSGLQVCNAFHLYWPDDATLLVQTLLSAVEPLADTDFREFEAAAKSFAKALGVSRIAASTVV
jgi:hypothetical protein